MADYKITLKIADIVIRMQSMFEFESLSAEEKQFAKPERFNSFIYHGTQKPDILINVELVPKLPRTPRIKPLFITYHFEDGRENWRLERKKNIYIYKSALEEKKQIMIVNSTFDKITAYLLPKKSKGMVWNFWDIIYDFLQILLISYLAQRNSGIFTHAIGVKDTSNWGLLFAGKSGAGKSTTAKLWYSHSKAMVLNDDRIIVRKRNGRFFIYGSPWHGMFIDYLTSRIESAPLKKIFFIYHSPKNIVQKISTKQAFNFFYPVLFPTFWDKTSLTNIVSFCQDLLSKVACYQLGFVNDKRIIEFVREIT